MNELGDLPSGWMLAPLRDVARINPPNPAGVPTDDTPVSFVPMAAVEELSGRMNVSTTREWAQVKKGFTRFQDGDVVFAKITPSMENGKVALAANLFNGVAAGTTEFHVFRPQSGVTGRYLLHYLLQEAFRRRARARMTGTAGQLRVPTQFLEEEVVPLAPTPEQQRIVEAIDSYVTCLDDAVASLERVRAKLKAYRASVLKAAVQGRLVPTEACLAHAEKRAYETATVLLSHTEAPPRPNRWNSRSSDVVLGHSALAVGNPRSALPEGWVWSPLVNIARMETGHTPSRGHPEWWDGDVPWIGIVDARAHDGRTIFDTIQHTNEAGLENSAARLLPAGTVCISRTASVGYVVVTGRAMATSQDFVNWIPTSAVSSEWLRVIFSADREALRRFGKGSVHKTIYFPEWLSVHVALPPLAEQARIGGEVDSLMSVTSVLEMTVATQLRRCNRLRQSILKWAFEGKLVDQDPTDEPAEQVIDRIRAERAIVAPASRSRGRTAKGAA